MAAQIDLYASLIIAFRYLDIAYLPPTYGLRSSISNGIPSCLFNMTSLQTLHLSGNGITGSLSEDLVLGPKLNDLSLSYNVLGGEHSHRSMHFTM